MSRHNCGCPIFALTPDVSSQRKMALYRNVRPLFLEQVTTATACCAPPKIPARKRAGAAWRLVVLTIGEPMEKSGGTNAPKLVRVGEHR
jgi:pyruvate kinase